jgi:putative hydrolase of HD superfamily
MPLLHNYSSAGALWRQNGIHEQQALARNATIAASSATLWELAQVIIAEAVERGFLPGSPATSTAPT